MKQEIVLACVPKSREAIFADDAFGVCSKCGIEVRYRPHAPAGVTLMCMGCVMGDITPFDTVDVTPETRAEIALYNSKSEGKA